MILKRMLAHPKNKRSPQKNMGVVYQVQCKDCLYVYTGVMDRRYGMRENELKRDSKTLEEKYTRSK